jgi:PAS domain-containing protein
VLGPRSADNHDMFYVFFLPIIWIAVRRGLRGATTGIFILDIGIIVSLKFSAGDPAHFAMLQFLMLILSLTGLILGALISDRERTEKRLSREEERVRLLLESVGEAVYGVDADGNCTFCNTAFLRNIGYATSQPLLGKNIHELIHHTRADGSPYPWTECPLRNAFLTGEKVHSPNELMWSSNGESYGKRAKECKRLGIPTILKPLRRLSLWEVLHSQKAGPLTPRVRPCLPQLSIRPPVPTDFAFYLRKTTP